MGGMELIAEAVSRLISQFYPSFRSFKMQLTKILTAEIQAGNLEKVSALLETLEKEHAANQTLVPKTFANVQHTKAWEAVKILENYFQQYFPKNHSSLEHKPQKPSLEKTLPLPSLADMTLFCNTHHGIIVRPSARQIIGHIDPNLEFMVTPLWLAAAENKTDIVRFFCEKGADVNAANCFGVTALHHAASHDNDEMANILLEKGALFCEELLEHFSPIHAALKYNARRTLLAFDRHIQSEYAKTLEQFLLDQGDFKAVARLLFLLKEDYALHHAFNKKVHKKIISNLIPLCKLNKENEAGQTPVILSVLHGDVSLTRKILLFDIDVNHRDHSGKTAFFYACSKNLFDMAALLLEHKADSEIADNQNIKPSRVTNRIQIQELIHQRNAPSPDPIAKKAVSFFGVPSVILKKEMEKHDNMHANLKPKSP